MRYTPNSSSTLFSGYQRDNSLELELSCGDLSNVLLGRNQLILLKRSHNFKNQRDNSKSINITQKTSYHLLLIRESSQTILSSQKSQVNSLELLTYNLSLSFSSLEKISVDTYRGYYLPEINPYDDSAERKYSLLIKLKY